MFATVECLLVRVGLGDQRFCGLILGSISSRRCNFLSHDGCFVVLISIQLGGGRLIVLVHISQ